MQGSAPERERNTRYAETLPRGSVCAMSDKNKEPNPRGISRPHREGRIRRVLQRVCERTGYPLEIVHAITGGVRGYKLQRMEGEKVVHVHGPLPGAVTEHYLNGMLVLLDLQAEDKRRALLD